MRGWALLWPFYSADGHCLGPSIAPMGTAMALLHAGSIWELHLLLIATAGQAPTGTPVVSSMGTADS